MEGTEPKRLTTVRIPADLDVWMRARAKDQGISFNEQITRMLRFAKAQAGAQVKVLHTEEWVV